jgi:hypothetical protein
MHRLPTIGSLAALLTLVAISTARADIPSPANSSVPPCFVGCPMGDIAFTVVVRDAANNPQPGSSVLLDFSTCPEVSFCTMQEPGTVINGSHATRVTDAFGATTFHLRAGGLCPSGHVRVFADGVPLGDRPIVSTDQDGNLKVDATDQSIASAKIGGTDLSADFDCDSDVDSADMTILGGHQGHLCDLATPAVPRTWGSLKVIYR